MNAQSIAELISLGLTIPTIVLSFAVVMVWGLVAKERLSPLYESGRPLKAMDWFILGVAAGFLGGTLDNLYWAGPWTAAFLDHPIFPTLTEKGAFVNIAFRQGAGMFAAFCHLKAAELSTDHKIYRVANKLLAASALFGALYALVLYLLR